jgi:subtilase family serine protease
MPVTQSGTYYLVFNTDADNALIEPDYSNNIAAIPITFNIQPLDLAPVALLAPSTITGPPYPTVTLVWGVTNSGTGPAIGADYWYDDVYLSSNPAWGGAIPLVTSRTESGPMQAAVSYWRTNTVTVPVIQSGTYYLFLRIDDYNSLYESAETNNVVVVPITFNIEPPDLAPVTSAVSNVMAGPPYPSITLVWGVTNQGIGAAIGRPSWSELIYFSKSPILEPWWNIALTSRSESGRSIRGRSPGKRIRSKFQ